METTGLKFTELHVRRMYGEAHDGLQARNLCGGLNIIYGPNAAGKTTLGRALKCVLWPDKGDGNATIEALFTLEGDVWRADLEGGNVRFQQSGRKADRPVLPPTDDCSRYHLYLHDLLQASEETSKPFARAILQEASGGIDIGAAQTSLDYKIVRPSKNNALTRAAESAWRKVKDARSNEDALLDEQRRLKRLEVELVEARDARARVEFLDRMIAFIRARDAAKEKKTLLEAFPSVLDDMTGEEPDRLRALREAHETAEAGVADARARIAEAAAMVEGSIIHEPGIADGLAGGLQTRVHRLERLEQETARVEKELKSLHTEQEECWKRIKGAIDLERARTLNTAEIGNLSEFVKEAEKVGAEEKVLRLQLDHYDPNVEESAADIEKCRDGTRILARWIEAGTAPSTSKSVRFILIVTAILLCAAAVVLGSSWNPLGFGLALPAALIVWTLWKLPGAGSRIDERAHLRREFERTGIVEPSAWNSDAVGELLEHLFDEVARHRDRAFRVERIGEAMRALERLQNRKEKLEERREQIVEQLGVQAEIGEEELYYLVEALGKWQDLDGTVRGREVELIEQRAQAVELLRKINADLRPFGFDDAADAAQAQQHVTALSDAATAYKAETHALSQARRDLQRAESIVEETTASIDRLFDQIGLDRDADAALHELAGRLVEYRILQKEEIEAGGRENGARERLEEHPLYDPEHVPASEEGLLSQREDAATAASRLDDVLGEIKDIEARVRMAERGHALEELRAVHENALEELRRKREEDYRAIVGWHLAEYVRTQTRDEQLPKVFHRARGIFAEITRQRYRLDFDERSEEFRAYDNLLDRGRELDQLSSGTRVQLLLAVRLAFLEQQENGVMVPLVLDETLANSDDGKAGEVISAVLSICRTGRQIFYFTAQEDEVGRWKQVLEKQDAVEHRIIALGDAPAPHAPKPNALPAPIWKGVIPSPDGRSHSEYRHLLRVPAWDFRLPVGMLHLWYLIEDVDKLHRVLSAGFERWGALKQLIELEGFERTTGGNGTDGRGVDGSATGINGSGVAGSANGTNGSAVVKGGYGINGNVLVNGANGINGNVVVNGANGTNGSKIDACGSAIVDGSDANDGAYLYHGDVGGIGLSREDCARLTLCARALKTWRHGWMIGRGKPVDRAVLVESDAVSDTFIDGVTELCASVNGCGVSLVRKLRDGQVKRFLSAKTDELEQYLSDHGFIDSLEPRTDEELWTSVVADVSGTARSLGVTLRYVQDFLERVAASEHA